MKISVVGTGYVGLVLGAGLASIGHEVVCIDADNTKVRLVSAGTSPIYEEGLDELLKKVINLKKFSATTDLKLAVQNTDVTFICVGTPASEDGTIDLSQIKAASAQIGAALRNKSSYHLVVVKSTVIPGTSSGVVLPIIKETSRKESSEFGICMNPEFLREGKAVEDFLNPDRIVIGELDRKSGDILAEAYAILHVPILRASLETAETIKYTSNALLATLISYSNEIANICETVPNVDVADVLNAVCLDKRLNPTFNGKPVNPGILVYLIAGCGFGGSCLPKDVNALVSFSRERGYDPKLLASVLSINEKRPVHLVDLAEKELGSLTSKRIAVLGLAFKPDSDDLRDSPAIPIINDLIRRGATVAAYDPCAMKEAKKYFQGVDLELCQSLRESIKGADACILVTKWNEFSAITPELLLEEMRQPVFIDGRRFLNIKDFKGKIRYIGVGLSQT